jgi:tetratricopeptide (TPR) repeat protein
METAAGKLPEAVACFDQARAIYTKRDDILRAVLLEANALGKQNKTKQALEILRNTLRIVPNAPASSLLKKLEMELRSARPAPAPATPRRP